MKKREINWEKNIAIFLSILVVCIAALILICNKPFLFTLFSPLITLYVLINLRRAISKEILIRKSEWSANYSTDDIYWYISLFPCECPCGKINIYTKNKKYSITLSHEYFSYDVNSKTLKVYFAGKINKKHIYDAELIDFFVKCKKNTKFIISFEDINSNFAITEVIEIDEKQRVMILECLQLKCNNEKCEEMLRKMISGTFCDDMSTRLSVGCIDQLNREYFLK